MKNISKFIILALSVITLAASCGKAEYQTYNYVSFDARRAKIPEACGTYEIPITVHHAKSCIVTYKVVDGSAINGTNFKVVDAAGIEDNSGTLQITDGAGKIYLQITDQTGVKTGNKTFNVELTNTASASKDVFLGATTTIKCTIMDADAAINQIIASWKGEGKDAWGDPATMSMYVDVIDTDNMDEATTEFVKTHPNANVIISDIDFPEFGLSSEFDIYGYFDENTNKLHIYANQPFNEYTFSGDLGEVYVGLSTNSLSESDDVVLSYDEGKLSFDATMYIAVMSHDDIREPNQKTVGGGLAKGFTLEIIGE